MQENAQTAGEIQKSMQGQQNRRQALQVLGLVESIASRLDRIRNAQARQVGLRLPNFSLLRVVQNAGAEGITVSDAAFRLGIRPQALSGPVSELVEEGLLERRVDPTDGRARRLNITRGGISQLDLGNEVRDRVLEEIIQQVPSPSVARLVLSRLETALAQSLNP